MSTVYIPPLSQSAETVSACPQAYVQIYIHGKVQPNSIPSERGADVHHVASEYTNYCAEQQVPADFAKRDELAALSGPVAGPILDKFLSEYTVDFAHLYGTEITLCLDEDFCPAYYWVDAHGEMQTEYRGVPIQSIPGVEYSEKPAAFIGTLDALYIIDDHGDISDFKTQFNIIEEDTFQGTLYSYFVLTHFPKLRKVRFQLQFVRYTKLYRETNWLREDMSEMQRIISRARERQIITHQNPDDAKAIPCASCTYCPLAKDKTCPIAEWNEFTVLSPVEHFIRSEWHRRMRALDMPVLKAHALNNGTISYTDGRGVKYTYGETEVPKTRIPLDDLSIRILVEHAKEKGDNLLDGRLNISSTKLKQLLNTKKRAYLRDKFENSVFITTTTPQFRVTTADEGLVYEQYDENYSE